MATVSSTMGIMRSLVSSSLLALAVASSTPSTSSVCLPSVSGRSEYESLCEGVKCSIIENANIEIEEMRREVIDEKKCIPTFGIRSDRICNQAISDFASNAPSANDPISTSEYDRKLDELESAIDAPLQVLYLRQLGFIREKALQRYRAAQKTSEASDYEAMLLADSQFVHEAEEATREGDDWDFSAERTHLQSVMNSLASSSKKLNDVQIKSGQQQNTAMQYLQQQQQMIQQLQMQLYGQTSPWNVGVAYRIPDTNINFSGTYQSGRANVQLSCVPDEYAPLLGPNGFTNGVGPGNLGLSLNLSV